MQLTKQHIWRTVCIVYIVLSLLFIGYTVWTNFKLRYAQQSYEAGQRATIEQLITQAQGTDCQPFSVYTDTQEVKLINVDCLQAAETTDTVSPAE